MTFRRSSFVSFPVLVSVVGLAVACGSSGPESTVGGDGTTPPGGATSTAPPGTPPTATDPPGTPGTNPPPSASGPIKTVFLILMENHSWDTIKNAGASADYINGTLAKQGAHAENYKTPTRTDGKSNHPSEPNYIWLEAGDNLGITNDNAPSSNHQSTKEHLTTMLEAKGVTWKAYAEGISAGSCPLTSGGDYDPKHTPMLYFDDVTNSNTKTSTHCTDHVRSFDDFAGDLTNNKVAQYNFITPNLCNDMHGELNSNCFSYSADLVKFGDDWLKTQIPLIQASNAYKDGGVIFVLWDEGDETGFPPTGSDGPIPLFVLSAKAKAGYASPTPYTHSSMLRTVQEIFGVTPFLRGAATSNDLSDMFTSFP